MGILAQTLVTLCGKTVLVDFMVIEDPMDFNMLLGRDYVYAMQAVVSTFFRVMYFNHSFRLSQEEFILKTRKPTFLVLSFLTHVSNSLAESIFRRRDASPKDGIS